MAEYKLTQKYIIESGSRKGLNRVGNNKYINE